MPFTTFSTYPQQYQDQVSRLYNLAKQDVAGYEAYATQLAGLCGSGKPNCKMLEDVLDGLFHIAKADGALARQGVDLPRYCCRNLPAR